LEDVFVGIVAHGLGISPVHGSYMVRFDLPVDLLVDQLKNPELRIKGMRKPKIDL